MDFIGEIDALFVEGVEDRPPAFRELAERLLDQSRRALRPRIEIGPGERARKTRMGIKAQSPARLGGEVELLDRPFLPLRRPALYRVGRERVGLGVIAGKNGRASGSGTVGVSVKITGVSESIQQQSVR